MKTLMTTEIRETTEIMETSNAEYYSGRIKEGDRLLRAHLEVSVDCEAELAMLIKNAIRAGTIRLDRLSPFLLPPPIELPIEIDDRLRNCTDVARDTILEATRRIERKARQLSVIHSSDAINAAHWLRAVAGSLRKTCDPHESAPFSPVERTKPLAEVRASDVPRGFDPEDVATDFSPEQ